MKIDSDIFSKYLQLLSLKGSVSNDEVIITINSNQIKSLTISTDQSTAMRSSITGEFEEIGEIGVNLPHLRKLVSAFNNLIDISIKDNKLILKTIKDTTTKKSKKVTTGLIPCQYIKKRGNEIDSTKFEQVLATVTGNEIKLNSEQVKEIVDDFNRNNNKNPEKNKIIITTKGKDFHLCYESGTETKIVTEFVLEEDMENMEVKVGNVFIDVLSSLNDDIILRLGDRSVSVTNKTNFDTEILVAQVK